MNLERFAALVQPRNQPGQALDHQGPDAQDRRQLKLPFNFSLAAWHFRLGAEATGADHPVGFVEPGVGLPATAVRLTPEIRRQASHAIAIHELAERLTATSNYVAAALRLSELTGDRSREIEALEKALSQLQRAGEIVVSLPKLLSDREQ